MASKRKNTDAEHEFSARDKKKVKLADARTISVQSNVPSSSSGTGLSKPPQPGAVTFDKMLPSVLDVEKFAEARAYEITAMDSAMKNARSSSTHRAWQTLPRHLRRRAASHDPRRVPLRLRDKARYEMSQNQTHRKLKKLPKLGRAKRATRTESFLRRQKDKEWLETHIWHAKRMKMENMWGYRLAVKPTEKAFRPSHRASMHSAIVHDASYYSLIELKGPENLLKSILISCSDPQGAGPGAQRYVNGSRTLETHIYKPFAYPFDLVGPSTILWQPLPLLDEAASAVTDGDSANPLPKKSKRRKGKKKAEPQHSQELVNRVVWVRCHPSIYDSVFAALQSSASSALDVVQKSSATEIEVELADLRGQVNAFEIMGPKCSQILKGALSPVGEDDREDFRKFWASLTDLQTTASVPRGMIIGFTVHDPRLKFPPKNAKPHPPSMEYSSSPLHTFPSSLLAQSDIWSESTRTRLKHPRYKKRDLDERKTKNLIPGTALIPLRQDDRIPIMLIQRSVDSPDGAEKGVHGWTLVVPSGWSMPFFSSLTFTGARVGGQRERGNQIFEAGFSHFPRDYPTTNSYIQYAKERATEEEEAWRRKPPAKRVNYMKLGNRSPWKADWEVVLGLKNADGVAEDLVTTQRPLNDEGDLMNIDLPPYLRLWLLQGSETQDIITSMLGFFQHSLGLFDYVNKLRAKRSMPLLESNVREDLFRGALVGVKVFMCTRGTPKDLAAIYSIPEEETRRWTKALQKAKREGDNLFEQATPEDLKLSDEVPPPDRIIGYITTGDFSLSRGQGFAIGAVGLQHLLELYHLDKKISATNRPETLLVKIHDRSSQLSRPAIIELIHKK